MKAAKKAGLAVALAGAMTLIGPDAQAGSDDQDGAGGVLVHRGAQVSSGSAAQHRTSAHHSVAVQRGQATVRRLKKPGGSTPSSRVALAAGEELWLFDRRTGKLVACALRQTSSVGKSRIACTRRSIGSVLR